MALETFSLVLLRQLQNNTTNDTFTNDTATNTTNSTIGDDSSDFRADDLLPKDDDQSQGREPRDSTSEDDVSLLNRATTDAEKYAFIFVAIAIAAVLFALYRCYVCCRRRQERRQMQLVNTQADTVLGDMAMIRTNSIYDDYDEEDGELI